MQIGRVQAALSVIRNAVGIFFEARYDDPKRIRYDIVLQASKVRNAERGSGPGGLPERCRGEVAEARLPQTGLRQNLGHETGGDIDGKTAPISNGEIALFSWVDSRSDRSERMDERGIGIARTSFLI